MRLLSYLTVSATATASHYAIYLGLSLLIPAGLASAIGGLHGAVCAWCLHRRITFPDRAGYRLRARRFLLVALVTALAHGLVVTLLVRCGFSLLDAQMATTVLLALAGALVHRFWSYAHD